MYAGWVEDNEGTVFWDTETNSQEEFDQNDTYQGLEGYSYVSDPDDARKYDLSNGDG